jgi:hypothetical protein
MSTTPTAIAASEDNLYHRLKSFTGAGLFLLFQRFPKLLQLHRNEQAWGFMRIALGIFGAALVVLPLSLFSLWSGYITAIFGLAMFLLSILLPPAETESDTDRKARELGAVTVVSGGEYQPGNAAASEVRLFVSPSHVWALDKHFNPLLVIPAPEITSLRVEPVDDHWLFTVRWADCKADFSYDGFFAERFARLADDSIRAAVPALFSPGVKSRAHVARA